MMTITELRTTKGLTHSDMAKMLQVSKQTYTRWEAKPQNISIFNAIRIAIIFNVSIDEITFLP